jgi:acyl-CoA synthetase (AMP-forming)/AMP-acid ligase II
MVTQEYVADDRANALAKIVDGQSVWHRMGDLGRLDEQGRLWFYGRKAHRVMTATGTLFTEPVEAVFNRHPAVRRSALVGVGPMGGRRPVICIERRGEAAMSNDDLIAQLRELAASSQPARDLDTFLIHPRFPVDIRHNAKIFREKLAAWAAERLR